MAIFQQILERHLIPLFRFSQIPNNCKENKCQINNKVQCEEGLMNCRKFSDKDCNLEINNNHPRNVLYKYCSFPEVTSNSLRSYNELQRIMNKKAYLQQIATLKTYSFNNIRVRNLNKTKVQKSTGNIFEKLRKIYRETVKIKKRNTIMKKKKECHLDGKKAEEMIDGIIKQKWEEAKSELNIDQSLSKHIIKQAENKVAIDMKISLNSPRYPYIPCPLQHSQEYVSSSGNSNNYKNTTLAPLFTVDPLIMDKQPNQNNKTKLISIDFWSQFPNKYPKPVDGKNTQNAKSEISNTPVSKINSSFSKTKTTPSISENVKQKSVVDKKCVGDTHGYEIVKPPSCNFVKPIVDETFPTENKSLLNKREPTFVGKYSVNNPNENNNLERGKEITKMKSTNISLRRELLPTQKSKLDSQTTKHLDLNFPHQMTSPNQFKHYKKVQENNFNKIINKVPKGKIEKVHIPRYTNNKLLKQIQRFYENNNTSAKEVINLSNQIKNETNSYKTLVENMTQPKMDSVYKGLKRKYPLTSPSTKTFKTNDH